MDYMLEQGEEDFYVLVTTQNLGSTSQELLY
jgi:hypothetical protein